MREKTTFLKRIVYWSLERRKHWCDVRAQHCYTASCTPPTKNGAHNPEHVPWPEIKPTIIRWRPTNWATLARARTIFILYSLVFPDLSHFMAHSRYSRNSCKKNDCLIRRCHMKHKGRNKEETSIIFNAICGKKNLFNRKLLWKLTYIYMHIHCKLHKI